MLSGFDHALLACMHYLATINKALLTPVAQMLSMPGNHGGVGYIIACLIMLGFKKTRKYGFYGLVAMAFSALIVSAIIKPIAARPRPYMSGVSDYVNWWHYIGATMESEVYSFPSGHTSVTMALVTTFVFLEKKFWPLYLCVLMVGMSRNYLMVHYPTDVMAGIVTGFVAAYLAVKLCRIVIARFHLEKYLD